jgi:acetate kinase
MTVFTLNAGSASLKFDLIERGKKLFTAAIEDIGKSPTLSVFEGKETLTKESVEAPDYATATRHAIQLTEERLGQRPNLIGHRVVHGGDHFTKPVVIDPGVIQRIKAMEELAPLHNSSAVSVIEAASDYLGFTTGMVAVFDTVFHRTIPDHARTYALPPDVTSSGGIRRYGFHGISHEFMRDRYASLTGVPRDGVNAVTLHLESGCSACAIQHGRSIDTSMGFTPLEGLVMGKRSGDIDPAIIGYLMRKHGFDLDRVEEILNKESGLFGLSGVSHDTRELMKHIDSNDRVRLAMNVFCYRVTKYVGAYLTAVNGARALVFGGGIGEDTPFVRAQVCAGLEWCGVRLDHGVNANAINRDVCISTDDSSLQVWIIVVDEALSIARQAEEVWGSRNC